MPASLPRIRKSMKVEPTARDKGLVLTLRVVAYDKGIVEVDGHPMSTGDEVDAWLGVADVITTTLREFHGQVRVRRRDIATG